MPTADEALRLLFPGVGVSSFWPVCRGFLSGHVTSTPLVSFESMTLPRQPRGAFLAVDAPLLRNEPADILLLDFDATTRFPREPPSQGLRAAIARAAVAAPARSVAATKLGISLLIRSS